MTTEKPKKNKKGRPTKYKQEFCDTVISVGEAGGWLSEMAEACDVHRSTMDEWAANYPDFSEALMRAKQKAQAWFERMGREGLVMDKFNSSLWQKQMSARHRDEYSEKQQVDHTSSDGSMTPVFIRDNIPDGRK
jgi:hypothetical protein